MKKINKSYLISFIFLITSILFVFFQIFTNHPILGGDYSLVNKEFTKDAFDSALLGWTDIYNLGQNNTPFMNYAPYLYVIGFSGTVLHLSGVLVERIFWWIPFFVLAFIAHFYLKRLLPINRSGLLSTIIFIFNAYTLMLLGGGQISGVGLAFVMAPIVLVTFIELHDKKSLRNAVLCGLLFAIQVMFDLRIAYVTMIAIGIYVLMNLHYGLHKKFMQEILFTLLYVFVIPLIITVLLHASWILPTIIYHQNPVAQLGKDFNSTQVVTFFSFAKFENTFSLLHPNWPENIFGKVGFMKIEFLVYPLLAFTSLFFIKLTKGKNRLLNKKILYFAILGLVGTFLAKGTNDPFGDMYLWMFQHVPGFVMFRDSTKFYLLVVISYAVLIPFSLISLFDWLKSKNIPRFLRTNYIQYVFVIITLFLLLLPVRQAFLRQLGGTFQHNTEPTQYQQLNQFLANQPQFFRTLWVPTVQRFGLHSSQHPAIYADEFLNTTNPQDTIKKINSPATQMFLQNAGVKYIIVPYDSESEIFLNNRQYDDKTYQNVVRQLDQLNWLKRSNQFGKIIVYEIPNVKERFWLEGSNTKVSVTSTNPVSYQMQIPRASKERTLVFADSFNANWIASTNNGTISSKMFEKQFNSFEIPQGVQNIKISYAPQEWVNRGVGVGLVTLIVCLLFLIKYRKI